MAAAIALGAYPVVRRITGRLERLRVRVEKLGAGDLGARIEVEGNDEVADLARCFNKAAERIEHLVNSQRSILAEASHELRSPLTRIRMAIELISEERDPELRERVSRDIADLDELIDELLLASRLEIMDELESTEPIDLVALVAEEAARVGIEIEGEYVQVMGTQSLLRRLVRNLLKNARRYGEDTPIELSVLPLGERGAQLTVCDRGPGVSPDERERIFEPFYRPSGTGEKSERGVGLGLALVRRIARHHNGEARCLPRTGGGTCIEVTLQTEESG